MMVEVIGLTIKMMIPDRTVDEESTEYDYPQENRAGCSNHLWTQTADHFVRRRRQWR